jgi:hypothetical protein
MKWQNSFLLTRFGTRKFFSARRFDKSANLSCIREEKPWFTALAMQIGLLITKSLTLRAKERQLPAVIHNLIAPAPQAGWRLSILGDCMRFRRAFAGDRRATVVLHTEANAESISVLNPSGSYGQLLGENRILVVCANLLRIASIIGLGVAACCLVMVIFASLALLVCFRKLRAVVAGLTMQLLWRAERALVPLNRQVNPDADPR